MTYRPIQRAQIQKYMNTYLSNLCEYLVTKREQQQGCGGWRNGAQWYIHTYKQTYKPKNLEFFD